MKKLFLFVLIINVFFLFDCGRDDSGLYTIGIFQVNDAPTLNTARSGFIQALEDGGLRDGVNVRLIKKNAYGDIAEVQRIAQEFVSRKVDMIVPFSTPCLQASLNVTRDIPIIFSSVANPYRAGAGSSPDEHLENVTGISSLGPIRQSLSFIKEILPGTKRLGTLWTPSEVNSEYYLELARERAAEIGMQVVDVPIANASEVLWSAQMLLNKNIDVIYQISDNTINEAFEAVGQVANENTIPLFGGFLLSVRQGACAALGWDFFKMGYHAGEIALRVKAGEKPGDIPFHYMEEVQMVINPEAAEAQGVEFPPEILNRADDIITQNER
ncbi:MAG: ABC transporter substrate-binding protein [Candidatus Aminicenantes bacterium]